MKASEPESETRIGRPGATANGRPVGPVLAMVTVGAAVAARPDTSVLAGLVNSPSTTWAVAGPEEVLVAACASGIWLLVVLLAATVLLAVGATLPGTTGRLAGRLAAVVVPRLLMRVLTAGVSVTVVSTGAALATEPDPKFDAVPNPPTSSLPASGGDGAAAGGEGEAAGAAGIDWPGLGPRTAVSPVPPSSDGPLPRVAAPAGSVEVRPGDSLWSIAARGLPPDAAASSVDSRWREWYEHNRTVIGPDPNLIRPGMLLEAPPDAARAGATDDQDGAPR